MRPLVTGCCPPALRGRALADPLVVDALETWASAQAASILAGLFLVAAVVLLVAVVPTLLMGAAPRETERAAIPNDERDPSGQSGEAVA